jgi:hypothetical protein
MSLLRNTAGASRKESALVGGSSKSLQTWTEEEKDRLMWWL